MGEKKFKVGDRVRHIERKTFNIGTVMHDDKTSQPYLVSYDGWHGGHSGSLSGKEFGTGNSCRWERGKDLELIEEEVEKDTTHKFKVGDRIKMIDDHLGGEIGTIVALRHAHAYTVRFDTWRGGHDGDFPDEKEYADAHYFVCDPEMELIKEADELKFKIGDRVLQNNKNKSGEIIEIDGTQIPYKILFDDGHTWWSYEENIKLIEEEEKVFKIGDRVMCNSKQIGYEKGTIIDISEPKDSIPFLIEFDTWRGGHEAGPGRKKVPEGSCQWVEESTLIPFEDDVVETLTGIAGMPDAVCINDSGDTHAITYNTDFTPCWDMSKYKKMEMYKKYCSLDFATDVISNNKNMKHEFNVGDRVRIRSWSDMEKEFGLNGNGSISCRCSFTKSMRSQCGKVLTIKEMHTKGSDGSYRVEFEEEAFVNSYSTDMIEPYNNYFSKTMTTLAQFAKDITLSKEEKLMREAGLKDSCGEYTDESRDLVMNKLVADNEAYLIEIATKYKADQTKK